MGASACSALNMATDQRQDKAPADCSPSNTKGLPQSYYGVQLNFGSAAGEYLRHR